MSTEDGYLKTLRKMSLAELQTELALEIAALQQLKSEGNPHRKVPYDDWDRQVSTTRETIEVIKQVIAERYR